MKSPYTKEDYYSPGWLLRADQVKMLDSFTCQHCTSKKNLTVHHKIYFEDREIWEYEDEHLITLCWECHKAQHYDSAIDNHIMNHHG